MGRNILVAEPLDILRMGLRTVFVEDDHTTHVYEAASVKDLHTHLHNNHIDYIIINQALITDISIFPKWRFMVLAKELNIEIFQAAYKHGACGYFLETASADLLRVALRLDKGSFLIEPTLAVQIMEYFSADKRFLVSDEKLTPREREIIDLLRNRTDKRTIAENLCISEATLKTHINNITKKCGRKQT